MHDLHGVISGISITVDRTTADQLSLASSPSNDRLVERLLNNDEVVEAFGLRTCHRVEAYVVADERSAGREALVSTLETLPTELICFHEHQQSIHHLMRVAAGLESAVIGEDEILGQVSDAYTDAMATGGIGPLLEAVVEKAIRVGKRVRTETAINEGSVSMAGAAVRKANSFQDLDGADALVIGAGEMAVRVARELAPRVDRLRIANRTLEHAVEVADEFDSSVTGHGLGQLDRLVSDVDVTFSATGSSDVILETDAVRGSPLVAVDLARPSDIDPRVATLDTVTRLDLDDVITYVRGEQQSREGAADRAESIVQEELDRLLLRLKRERADHVISAMYEGAADIKERELEIAIDRLAGDVDRANREVLEDFADALVSKLLAAPTHGLREAAENDDWETIEAAIRLFEPISGAPATRNHTEEGTSVQHGRS